MMRLTKLLISVFIAIFLILSDYKFSYLDRIKQSFHTLLSPIYLLVNIPTQVVTWVGEQSTGKQALLTENQQLKGQLNQLGVTLQTHNALLLENQKLTQLLNASYVVDNKKFVAARINNVSLSRLKKQIIINKGANDGVDIGQIVLGAAGVVGQITQTTPWHATVLMITDPTQHIPIKNQRNSIRGIGKGLAIRDNKLMVNFIEPKQDIKIGDIFVSSAIGGRFPSGYPVGKVIRVEQLDYSPFLNIELEPIEAVESLEFVLVNTQ